MSAKLNEIDGLMEKEKIPRKGFYGDDAADGFNECLEEIGSESIKLDRDKGNDILYHMSHNEYGDAKLVYDLSLLEVINSKIRDITRGN